MATEEKEVDVKHVLIAEDEAVSLYAMDIAIRMAGYHVTIADDGYQALAKILASAKTDTPIDVLVTDLQMPGLSGLELFDELERKGVSMPVLVITGFGNNDTIEEVKRRRISEFLLKPFAPDDLIRSITKLFMEKEVMERNNNHSKGTD